MFENHDHPFDEVVRSANAQIDRGATVYQKFTCAGCGSRQTMDTPDTFYTSGKCEVCGHVTDIQKQGHNFLAILPMGMTKR